MPELLLALDIGTTTVRAAIFAADGALQALAASPVRSVSPRPGYVEQDAQKVWRAVQTVIGRTLAACGRRAEDLAAIGVTSQRTSIVLWDHQTGHPLGPIVVWSDVRGADAAAELRAEGFMLAAQQAAAKLPALVAAAPPARLAWGNIDSFVISKLTGGAVHATDRSQAWPTGYLDLTTGGWKTALIAHQGLDEAIFPRLVDSWGAIGVTARSVLGAEVPIAADIADQQAALIAHGEAAGVAKVSYGTSATLDVGTGSDFLYKIPALVPFVQSSVNGSTNFCLEGMVFSAGSAFDWLRGVARLGGHDAFEALAASVADTGGAWFLPALHGLGAPHDDPTRRAGLGGLSGAVDRGHIARAAMEGVAFRVREVFEHVYGRWGAPEPEFLGVDGGLTGNDAFLQIQADLLGRAIRRHGAREATACGAAIGAGRGVGLLAPGDLGGFVRYDRVFEPMIGADEAAERFAAWKSQAYA